MRVVTSEIMRVLDRRAIKEGGIPGAVLMENAGRAVFEAIRERWSPLAGRAFTVYCGTGNNGGDGFVAARYLQLAGARVAMFLAGEESRIQGDARTHFDVLGSVGVRSGSQLPAPAIAVDALLGTGAAGAPRGAYADAIRRMNADPYPAVAIDIPSGVDSDTGAVVGDAVRADLTVTFGYPKLGLLLAPGADCVGELVVSSIGFAWDSLSPSTPYSWIRSDVVRSVFSRRPRDAHKGQFGHVLVVGGSRGMSGAPTMAARTALRCGAGLVTIAAPESAQELIAPRIDEAMTRAVAERDGALCVDSFEGVREGAEAADALCVGPGGSQQPEARRLFLRVIQEIDRPMVIDADGLNALAQEPGALQMRAAPVVLTPHPGECARLLGRTVGEIQADRLASARDLAERFRAVVVLKGARSLVADGRVPGESMPIGVNTNGNPGMATGGSGDCLTGLIGALLGRGVEPFEAARAGVFLHGRAGDLAAAVAGEEGLIAGDIIDSLPQAIRELEEVA